MSAGDYSEKRTVVTRLIFCYEMLATMTSPVMAIHKAVNVSCCCLASPVQEIINSKSLAVTSQQTYCFKNINLISLLVMYASSNNIAITQNVFQAQAIISLGLHLFSLETLRPRPYS
jgi:hypothetical protein